MTQRRAVLALLAGTLALAAACTERSPGETPPSSEEPVFGGTAVVAASGELHALNSLVTSDKYTQEILGNALFLPLVRFDSALEYQPALARSWELLGDTAVVFHLRTDVRWHDGVPTTAEDVVFTFRRALDPATAFPNGDVFALWKDVEVLDPATVRFRFEPHAEPLAGLPFMPMMPRHLLDSIPAARLASAAFNKRPVGNGPFRFVEYRPNDRYVFEANPDFPAELGGRPYLDRIVWRIIPDGTAQAAELRTGNADLMLGPRTEQFADLDADPRLRGLVQRSRNYAFIGWNARTPPLGDPRVRRALSMAIDRQRIIDVLRAGHGEQAVGPIGPFHWAYDSAVAPLPFDRDSARALLRLAGVQDADNDGILEAGGRDLEIELKYQAGTGMNRDLAEMVQADLAAIGVRATARPTEWAVMIEDITSPDRKFDAVMMGWSSEFRLGLRDLFHSESRDAPLGFAGYGNPEVDRHIDAAARATDRASALPALRSLQRIIREEQPWTFLYYFPDLYVLSERIRGVEMDERGALVNITRWWIPVELRSESAAPAGDSAARSPIPDSVPAR